MLLTAYITRQKTKISDAGREKERRNYAWSTCSRKISLLLLQLSFCFPVLTKNDLAASEPLWVVVALRSLSKQLLFRGNHSAVLRVQLTSLKGTDNLLQVGCFKSPWPMPFPSLCTSVIWDGTNLVCSLSRHRQTVRQYIWSNVSTQS